MPSPRHTPTIQHQRGASLMVMLVILVIGIAALLVGSLNSSALNNSRQQQTSAALAQARDALIGRAAADANAPGSLPCPDSNDDGSAELMAGNDCPHYIGRLPWRTLGLTELRDGSGEHLWYALSRNFRDDSTAHINSDTQGTLNITGTQTASNLVAIVFSAGNPLSGQSRSPSNMAVCATTSTTVAESLCASNYLELSNANPSPAAMPNVNYQTAATNTFNDQSIFIAHDQNMSVVEMRIAREVKSCLDNYAMGSASKYPWAAPVSDYYYQATNNTYFGRIPVWPMPADPNVASFLSALVNLQIALANYITNNTSTTRSTLNSTGSTLENIAQTLANNQPSSPLLSSTTTSNAKTTGDKAQDLAQNPPQTTVTNVQNLLASSLTSLQTDNGGMAPFWPSGCILASSTSYWSDWRNEVFYQVANGYQPGSSASSGVLLTINGSGPYRATVLIARAAINSTQFSARSSPWINPPTPYLEGINPHTGSTPTTTFNTYSLSDPNYSTVNDLVLCLDGKGTNPSSVCP